MSNVRGERGESGLRGKESGDSRAGQDDSASGRAGGGSSGSARGNAEGRGESESHAEENDKGVVKRKRTSGKILVYLGNTGIAWSGQRGQLGEQRVCLHPHYTSLQVTSV